MSAAAAVARIAVVGVALALAWRVVAVNAFAYDDAGRPRVAGDEPGGESRAMAAVLRGNPAEVAALVALAQDQERRGDAAGAARTHEAGSRIAPVEPEALLASGAFDIREGRLSQGLATLERALAQSRRPDLFHPVLAQLLAMPALQSQWRAIVDRDPPWLAGFIIGTCRRGGDVSALLPIAMARAASGKAAAPETGCVIDRLREEGRWEEAHQLWLNTLPAGRLAEVGYVFNGGFEHEPSGIGFDWAPTRQPERQAGHAVSFAPAPGASGQRALRVAYNGKRQSAPAVTQYLAVAPGRYALSGRARASTLRSVRGVQWTLRCLGPDGRSTVAGRSPAFMGNEPWRPFAFEVAIGRDCPGQQLRLEPVGLHEGTVFLAGEAWFDEMRLTRLD